MPLALTTVFADLPDPRIETANKLHPLTDILVIATCAVIAGPTGGTRSPSTDRARRTSFVGSWHCPAGHGFNSATA